MLRRHLAVAVASGPSRIASSVNCLVGGERVEVRARPRATALAALSVWQSPQRRAEQLLPVLLLRVRSVTPACGMSSLFVDRARSTAAGTAIPSTSSDSEERERREPAAAARLRVQHRRRGRRARRSWRTAASRGRARRRRGRRRACSRVAIYPLGRRSAPFSAAVPDAKLWIGGETWRNSPSVDAASRPPCAPSPRPVAAAATRRSASATTSRLDVVGRDQRPHAP